MKNRNAKGAILMKARHISIPNYPFYCNPPYPRGICVFLSSWRCSVQRVIPSHFSGRLQHQNSSSEPTHPWQKFFFFLLNGPFLLVKNYFLSEVGSQTFESQG